MAIFVGWGCSEIQILKKWIRVYFFWAEWNSVMEISIHINIDKM